MKTQYLNWIEEHIKDPAVKRAMIKQLENNDRGLRFMLNAKVNLS